jgi:hypothetical protein
VPFTPFAPVAAAGIQPYQFSVDAAAYGAKGDGQVANDAATNGTATFTSVSVSSDPAAVGKTCIINGGLDPAGTPWVGKILSVAGTSVTLDSPAVTTISGAQVIWGSDDTAAINAAATAAGNFALGISGSGAGFGNYYAEVTFSAKIYMLASGPTQTGNGSTTPTFNAQIPLPYPNVNGTSRKLVIGFTGASNAGQLQFWLGTIPNIQGTVLVSAVKAPAQPAATFGWQSVIGGPTGAAGFTGSFANVKAVMRNLTVVTPTMTQQHAYDFRYIASRSVSQCSAQPTCSVAGNSPTLPSLPGTAFFQSRGNTGLADPVIGNNDDGYLDSFAVEGFETGIATSDHCTAGRVAVLYCDAGLLLQSNGGLSGLSNLVSIANYSCELTNSAIVTNGGTIPVNINATLENINTWEINDTANALRGVINRSNTGGGAPSVNGGANVEIRDRWPARAVQGAPSYTLGTAFQNPWWSSMWVQLAGGTTTGILIGPTSAAATTSVGTTTPVTFKLPAGWWLNIQGSVKPTTFNAVPD